MSLLDRIRECQRWEPRRYRPFRIEGRNVGWVALSRYCRFFA